VAGAEAGRLLLQGGEVVSTAASHNAPSYASDFVYEVAYSIPRREAEVNSGDLPSPLRCRSFRRYDVEDELGTDRQGHGPTLRKESSLNPEPITEHVYRIDAGALGVYLIALPESLTLIDAGFPGTMATIGEAVRLLGRRPEEIHDVLVTHCHPDHAAGLAEVRQATRAHVWMHPADAELVRAGQAYRPWKVAPGIHNRIFTWRVIRRSPITFEPVPVDREVPPGGDIPVAGGMKAIGTPGHTAGHLVFLWPGDGGVLFAGDAAKNERRLEPGTIYEDFRQGLESLRVIGSHEFEVACFAHGAPLVGGAAKEFRRRWS
jgi:glyoxylase-like metal-dependent hydrolase (beta-lactamase superfamily II)